MTTVIENIEELIKIIDENAHCALRGASTHDLEIMKETDILDNSLNLYDRRDCDYDETAEELNGTCGIYVTRYFNDEDIMNYYAMAEGYARWYHGTNVVLLIAGKTMEYGEDDGEAIIGDGYGNGAKVIAIVKLH